MNTNIMINPTGLVLTDQLILQICGRCAKENRKTFSWRKLIRESGIPDEFLVVAQHFYTPFNPIPRMTPDIERFYLSALDILLWDWIEPLAQEWFTFFQGMRQDILSINGKSSIKRIKRIQSTILAPQLTETQFKSTRRSQ